jgi:general secretion pathway protein G
MSIVPGVGFILVIPALVMGEIARRKIRKSDGALKGKGLAIAGLCAGAVGLIVCALLAVGMWMWCLRITSMSAKDSPTTTEIKSLCSALELYSIDNGAYPTTEQGLQALVARPPNCPKWNGPYLDGGKLPDDAWKHPYVYRCPGVKVPSGFDLYSAGPDGKPGTGDDIGNW